MNPYSTAHRNIHSDNTMMKYNETPEFTRDVRKLEKRFKTLREDFELAKKGTIELNHIMKKNNNGVFQINNAGNTPELEFYKMKKLACRSLPGKGNRSGIRVIYAYFPKLNEVVFLEMYFKGDKENEDRKRIKEFIRNVS